MRDPLTAAELRVMALVATGKPNVEIAAELWVVEQTVKYHVKNATKKLGVTNRTAAVWRCLELGILAPPTPCDSDVQITRLENRVERIRNGFEKLAGEIDALRRDLDEAT